MNVNEKLCRDNGAAYFRSLVGGLTYLSLRLKNLKVQKSIKVPRAQRKSFLDVRRTFTKKMLENHSKTIFVYK